MQKKLTAVLLIGVAPLFAGAAYAADAIEPAGIEPVEIALPADNPFNGFYVGVHAGYTSATSDETFYGWANAWNSDFYGLDADGALTNDLSGASLGAQAGVNYVMDSGLMIGGEVSVSWAAIQGSTNDVDMDYYDCDCGVYGGEFTSTIDAMGAGVFKAGYATDKFMVYGVAGLALAHVGWTDEIGGDSDDGNWFLRGSGDGVRQGWTVGVGGSVMVTEDTSIDLQYNYANFGTLDVSGSGELSTADTDPSNLYAGGFDKSVSLTSHTIKIGVNQHF